MYAGGNWYDCDMAMHTLYCFYISGCHLICVMCACCLIQKAECTYATCICLRSACIGLLGAPFELKFPTKADQRTENEPSGTVEPSTEGRRRRRRRLWTAGRCSLLPGSCPGCTRSMVLHPRECYICTASALSGAPTTQVLWPAGQMLKLRGEHQLLSWADGH